MDTEQSDATQLEHNTWADQFRIRLKEVSDLRDEICDPMDANRGALRQGQSVDPPRNTR
jgi:hypothetical protein